MNGIAAANSDIRRESSTRFIITMRLFRPLPVGWETRINENDHIYYLDHLNKTSNSIHPRRLETGPGARSHYGIGQLPPGWEMRLDKKSNRIYFVDHNKKGNQLNRS